MKCLKSVCLVSCHEVGADIELFFVDVGKVFCCPSVVRFAAAYVAGFDVDGCFLCHIANAVWVLQKGKGY